MCSKCPPSTETHTGWSHLIWHNFIKVADNWIKIRSLAYIGMHNRHVKFGRKIPNRFGKIATKLQGDFFYSHCTCRCRISPIRFVRNIDSRRRNSICQWAICLLEQFSGCTNAAVKRKYRQRYNVSRYRIPRLPSLRNFSIGRSGASSKKWSECAAPLGMTRDEDDHRPARH